jgi:hypothetical protein
MVVLYLHSPIRLNGMVFNYLHIHNTIIIIFFLLPRCSHTWERAPVSEHRADLLSFLIRTVGRTPWTGD